ncbi:MAG: hypothetical protein LKE96_02390 [Acetobacter peroxydans]|nr:hypothetical protein [Acetobacter peroxydans]
MHLSLIIIRSHNPARRAVAWPAGGRAGSSVLWPSGMGVPGRVIRFGLIQPACAS